VNAHGTIVLLMDLVGGELGIVIFRRVIITRERLEEEHEGGTRGEKWEDDEERGAEVLKYRFRHPAPLS
jgi:hypothetical protein